MANFKITHENRKVIPGYGGKYEVSDHGNVFSCGRELEKIKGKYVSLSCDGSVRQVKICYLVARAFLSNIEGRPYVVHKDGNLDNNRSDNLAWSETEEKVRGRRKGGSPVWVSDRRSGEFVGRWDSLREACRVLGVDFSNARRVAEGTAKSAGGYVFRWWE